MPNEGRARRPGEYIIVNKNQRRKKDKIEKKPLELVPEQKNVFTPRDTTIPDQSPITAATDDFEITVDDRNFSTTRSGNSEDFKKDTLAYKNPPQKTPSGGFDFPDHDASGEILPKDRLQLEHDYVLTGMIGIGGMGEVWEAKREDGLDVVVKKMKPQFLLEVPREAWDNYFKRMVLEGEILEHLDSVHFPKFIEADPDGMVIVMERLHGKNLSEKIYNQDTTDAKQEPDAKELDPLEAAFIAAEVADGMAHAHKKGFIHRDLKPSNIFIEDERDGIKRIKILDLGLAYSLEDARMKFRRASKKRLTVQAMAFGTPVYMSPEQVMGKAEKPADVYALGAVLYEMLAGEGPFNKVSDELDKDLKLNQSERHAKLWQLILTSQFKKLSELKPDLPETLLRLVDLMLAGNQKDRPTMEQVRDELEVFLHDSKLGVSNRNEIVRLAK